METRTGAAGGLQCYNRGGRYTKEQLRIVYAQGRRRLASQYNLGQFTWWPVWSRTSRCITRPCGFPAQWSLDGLA
jgi:hypothetical protein